MSFFEWFLGARKKAENLDPELRRRMLKAWGLEEDAIPQAEEGTRQGESQVVDLTYDRAQWHRRLKTMLGDLPDSEEEWEHLISDARAKGFDPEWVSRTMKEEFTMMVRAALADRVFTERERLKLDKARFLIGLTEEEASRIYKEVATEAERFFGGSIESY